MLLSNHLVVEHILNYTVWENQTRTEQRRWKQTHFNDSITNGGIHV